MKNATLIFLWCSFAAIGCAHNPPCRAVASGDQVAGCDALTGKVVSFSHRKELLSSLPKKETSIFEVVRSKLPIVKAKTVRSSSAEDVANELKSIDLKALAKRDFLVYLDLDDTLLEQWAPFFIENYHSLTIREDGQVDWYIALAPGLDKLLRTIRSLNGGIILYSRNYLRRVEALADLINVSGMPLRQSVDGVLSEPYTKDGKFKDLTVVRHPNAIILDDSPESVLSTQWNQVMDLEKFKPDIVKLDQELIAADSSIHPSWVIGSGSDDLKLNFSNSKPSVEQFMRHHERKMDTLISNIVAAHARSKKDKISFLEAFRPYSYGANQRRNH